MGEEQCTPHSIRAKVLDEIILEEIRKATYYARAKTKEFVEFINKKSSSENRRELTAKTNEFNKFKTAYLKTFNEEPSLFSAYGYDAMQMIIYALNSGTSNSDIHNGFKSLKEIDTFSGKLVVLPDGDCDLPLMIGLMKSNGTYDILKEVE